MIVEFAKKFLWHPPYPIRKPALWAKQLLTRSSYHEWLDTDYPAWVAKSFDLELKPPAPSPPEISLITLVYNPKYSHFKNCVESVLQQNYTNYEWILVNNGTTDKKVLNLLKKLNRFPHIKIVTPEKPLGIAKGTQYGVECSSFKWLAFLDHDDLLLSDALTDLGKVIYYYKDTEFIYSDSDHCDEVNTRFQPLLKPGPSPEYILGSNYITHFHAITKLKFLDFWESNAKVDGSQDWDLTIKAIHHCKCIHIPKILYSHRVHPSQFSANLFRKRESQAKEQLKGSQKRCLENYLNAVPNGNEYSVDKTTTPGALELMWNKSSNTQIKTISKLSTVTTLDSGNYFALIADSLKVTCPDWYTRAVGLLEREPEIALVIGQLFSRFDKPIDMKIMERSKRLPITQLNQARPDFNLRREIAWAETLFAVGRRLPIQKHYSQSAPQLAKNLQTAGLRVVFDPKMAATIYYQ